MVMDESDASDRLISDNSTQLSKDIHSLVVKYNDPNAQCVAKLKGQMKDIQASLSSAISWSKAMTSTTCGRNTAVCYKWEEATNGAT